MITEFSEYLKKIVNAKDWLVCPENINENLSIDEVFLSKEELNTIVISKS